MEPISFIPPKKTRVAIFDDLVHVEVEENMFHPNNAWGRALQLLVHIFAGRVQGVQSGTPFTHCTTTSTTLHLFHVKQRIHSLAHLIMI